MAIGISYWLNAIVLGLYMKYSSTCKNTLVPISVPMNWGVFSLCYPFCYDDLVNMNKETLCWGSKAKKLFSLQNKEMKAITKSS